MEKSNPSDSIPLMCKANKVKFIFCDTRTIVTIVVQTSCPYYNVKLS